MFPQHLPRKTIGLDEATIGLLLLGFFTRANTLFASARVSRVQLEQLHRPLWTSVCLSGWNGSVHSLTMTTCT
jgi:hypothetical protein